MTCVSLPGQGHVAAKESFPGDCAVQSTDTGVCPRPLYHNPEAESCNERLDVGRFRLSPGQAVNPSAGNARSKICLHCNGLQKPDHVDTNRTSRRILGSISRPGSLPCNVSLTGIEIHHMAQG